ncbi:MAG: nitrous oxide reductase accessory protein NosL [Gammaproteobacteria bacterium]
MKTIRFVVVSILLLLAGCGKQQTTGAEDVRWDREICARCAMAVSDHYFAAQIRGGPKNEKAKVYKFDDIGCAVIWLDKQPWKASSVIEIWVTDHRNGNWIDARKAWYVKRDNTPMDYGLGAQPEKVQGALNYEQAVKHVYTVEQRSNHGGHSHMGHP